MQLHAGRSALLLPLSRALSGESRLIIAIDTPHLAEGRALALAVRDAAGMLKIGLELFIESGAEAIAIGHACDRPVFLDLKLHDIPETVERSVARVSALGVKLVTVHACGGRAMLTRAVERAAKEGGSLQIVAVTVLTSMDDADLRSVGVARAAAEQALVLAHLAFDCGVRAFVCSPHEARLLRSELGPSAMLITPGVRPAGADAGDQKRVATPRQAIVDGADAVVVGRPIRDAADPLAAAWAIARELEDARRSR